MKGDQNDIVARLRSVLPLRWFSDNAPNLTAVLTGLSATWTQLYSLLIYTVTQSRITTATEFWLDIISDDYLGRLFTRRPGEGDAGFRLRIMQELVRERCTRAALFTVLSELTGQAPIIFEPAHCADTGAYAIGSNPATASGTGLYYGVAGGWGNLDLPFTVFAKVNLTSGAGIALLPGWDANSAGYGAASTAYGSSVMIQEQVEAAYICQGILSVLPIAVTAWVQVAN